MTYLLTFDPSAAIGLSGPFATKELASAAGRKWQRANQDCPCWQTGDFNGGQFIRAPEVFTVVLGDFADMPGVWHDIEVPADAANPVETALAQLMANPEYFPEGPQQPAPSFSLVGIYRGALQVVPHV